MRAESIHTYLEDNMQTYPKITIRNFGPFEHARLELRPLTILIGKNSVGKSLLAYLIWILTSTVPDFETLGKKVSKQNIDEIAKKVLREVGKGLNPISEVKSIIKMHIDALPHALISSLKELIPKALMTTLNELIKEGEDQATIRIEGPHALLELLIKDNDIKIIRHKPYAELIEELEVAVPRPSTLRIIHNDKVIVEERITSIRELVNLTIATLAYYTGKAFAPFFTTTEISALLPDSRAGLSRTLLRPYTPIAIAKNISYVDEEFINLYFRLAEHLDEGLIELDMLKPLLNELGYNIEVVYEKGIRTIYIETWSGKRLPIPLAPSGIRESLTVALALASMGEPKIVIIEEPEAHLHPRAQKHLAKLIAKSINTLGKTVLITTHSDYLIYTINNLIALSNIPEKAKQLGYQKDETLNPNIIAAYLIKPHAKKATIQKLEITNEGIPEDEFTKVAQELADERAEILT